MVTKKIKLEMLERFQQQYGILKPALHYNTPFELLVAVVLSAQCTDERVNIVTAGLFPMYSGPEKILSLGLMGLEEKYILADYIEVKLKIFWLRVLSYVNNIMVKYLVLLMN